MKLSEDNEYLRLFKEMYEQFNNSNINGSHCLFFPMIGQNFEEKRILVVGRACNGWIGKFNCGEICTVVDESIKFSETNEDFSQMKWLWGRWNSIDDRKYCPELSEEKKKYHVRKSAFWRVVGKLVDKYIPSTYKNGTWMHHIAWSNLYKISPSIHGNPSKNDMDKQLNYCKNLFKSELKILRPRIALLITDLEDWATEFIDNTYSKEENKDKDIVKGIYTFDETKIIVTVRPEGKKEDDPKLGFVPRVSEVISQVGEGL